MDHTESVILILIPHLQKTVDYVLYYESPPFILNVQYELPTCIYNEELFDDTDEEGGDYGG